MRTQWVLLGLFVAVVTLASARCAPGKESQRIGVVDRRPVERHEGLIDTKRDAGAPPRRGIPLKPSPDQKKPPCDAEMGEEPRFGACYVPVAGRKPPCGRLLEDGDQCFRAVFVAPREPSSIGR